MKKYKVTITIVRYEYANNKNQARHFAKQKNGGWIIENRDCKVDIVK
jgi:hypothetical protein